MRLAAALVLGVITLAGIGGILLAGEEYSVVIDPAAFQDLEGNPLPIDNPYLPLVPGTLYLYEGEARDTLLMEVVSVSHDTKKILGVTCTVVDHWEWFWDEATTQWKLKEETNNWHAQDAAGVVWYFGEDTTAFDDADDFDTTEGGSWEAGVDGALPGVAMPANPIRGLTYRLEYYKDVAEDMAKVLNLNSKVSTEFGAFRGALQAKEWTPLEPGAVENKFYAEGVGFVLGKGPKGSKAYLELVAVLAN